MDEVRPLLQDSPEALSPNLRPRHQDLLPTPCGPMKRWSELPLTARVYFCLIVASLLVLFGLTVPTYRQRTDPHLYNEDFAVSIIQLMGVLFCIYYISRGVLQENRLELVVFVLSLLVVMVRSLINFIVVGPEGRKELLARFLCIMLLGVFHIFGTIFFFLWSPNTMAFRVGGALESVQEHYFLSNLCFSMVTFDLQAQLCLCILITASDGGMSTADTAVLTVGVAWACLTAAVGAVAVSSKGSQRSGVDLHDPEPSPAGLLWVSDLHSGEEMVQRPDVHQRGGGGLWSTAVTAHQSRVAVGAHQVAAGFQTQTPGDRVSIQEVMAVCVICGSSPRIGAASSHPKHVRCRPSGPSG